MPPKGPLLPTEEAFQERVMDYAVDLLRLGPMTFRDLLRRAQNAEPVLLQRALAQAREDGVVKMVGNDQSSARFVLPGAVGKMKVWQDTSEADRSPFWMGTTDVDQGKPFWKLLEPLLCSLPEASPVFSQWWFSRRSYPYLLRFLSERIGGLERVAFIGCPTLGALYSNFSRNKVAILDVDEQILRGVSGFCSRQTDLAAYDVSLPLPGEFRGSFEFAVADPPWARHTLSTFLTRSSGLLSVGGTLAISFPQMLTRPGIAAEREKLKGLAAEQGLTFLREIASATEYCVPIFEQLAFAAGGLKINKPWRRGDFFLFKKTRKTDVGSRQHQGDVASSWRQYALGNARIFLRRDGDREAGHPVINPLPDCVDYICTTTSSRSEIMRRASLVSTRNRVAEVHGRARLSRLFPRLLVDATSCVSDEQLAIPASRAALISSLRAFGGIKNWCGENAHEGIRPGSTMQHAY